MTVDDLTKVAQVLREQPDVLTALQLLDKVSTEKVSQITVPVKTDRFIERKQAMEILNVGAGTFCRYVKEGLVGEYKLPYSQHMKFKLSEILEIPQKSKEM